MKHQHDVGRGTGTIRRVAWMVVAAVLLLGIAHPVAAQGTPVASGDAPVPDTEAGRQFAWVLAVVNGEATATPEEIEARFAETFLAAASPQVIAFEMRIAAGAGPYDVVAIAHASTENHVTAAVTDAAGVPYRAIVGVEGASPFRITNLELDPVSRPGAPVADWAELDGRLAALAPGVSFLAAELSGDACRALHELNGESRQPIASGFKLYVLGELARQVAAGEANWDEELAIRDDWKSYVLTGNMQYEPAGTVHTLRHYAEQMIWVSDNTATDHLIGRLGRENVEATMARMGHADPALNTPLLTTREFHTLLLNEETRNQYLASDVMARRAMLANEIATIPAPSFADANFTPAGSDRVGWFASAGDLCRAMASLHAMFDDPGLEPLAEIVALDPVAIPAVALDPATWPYIGFKGGRHEGVRSLTLLLQRADGRWFVIAGAFGNPVRSLDNGAVNGAMTAAAAYLSGLP